jgi:hypothetical protein
MEQKRRVLFDEIDFFEKTGLNKDLKKSVKNGSPALKDINIITPAVIERIEKNYSYFLKFGSNPF